MSEQTVAVWNDERVIAEVEGVAASWHRVLDREQVYLLRGQILSLLRRQLAECQRERDNWRESFHNMTIIAKSQLDDLEELERENTALAQRLAQAWQPVEDGIYHTDGVEVIYVKGQLLNILGEHYIYLRDGYRLCQRRPQAQDSTTAATAQEVEGNATHTATEA